MTSNAPQTDQSTDRYLIERGDVVADRTAALAVGARNLRSFPEARYEKYYERNPAGQPWFWMARERTSGATVGMFALIPMLFRVSGELVRAGIQADFAVDREHRGFSPAIPLGKALHAGTPVSGVTLVVGTPNPMSGPVVRLLGYRPIGFLDGYAKPLRLEDALDGLGWSPPWIRPASRLLDPLLRVVFRDDRYRLRSRGYTVERPALFDERFETLFEEARRTYPIMSERSAETLNWKYELGAGADSPYAILAVLDPSGSPAAYAVWTEREGIVVIKDLLALRSTRALDVVLGHVIAEARRRGAHAVALRYFGPDNGRLVGRLRSFGFVRRRDDSTVVAHAVGELPGGVDPARRENWYFLGGDRDI